MSVWGWWLDDPTLTSAVMRSGSFVKTQGENAFSKQFRVDWTWYNIDWKKDTFPTQELSFVVRKLWRGRATDSRSTLVVEFLFSFKKLQMFRNCGADDNIWTENLRMLSTLFRNKCGVSLPLLLALYFCFVQINFPKLFFPQIGVVCACIAPSLTGNDMQMSYAMLPSALLWGVVAFLEN